MLSCSQKSVSECTTYLILQQIMPTFETTSEVIALFMNPFNVFVTNKQDPGKTYQNNFPNAYLTVNLKVTDNSFCLLY